MDGALESGRAARLRLRSQFDEVALMEEALLLRLGIFLWPGRSGWQWVRFLLCAEARVRLKESAQRATQISQVLAHNLGALLCLG